MTQGDKPQGWVSTCLLSHFPRRVTMRFQRVSVPIAACLNGRVHPKTPCPVRAQIKRSVPIPCPSAIA